MLRQLGGGSKPVPHRDVDQLFAECLAKPDDDAPRAVLADALLEREDPRGELIALQLRPELGEAETKRVAALLRKHEKQWLGELHRITKLRVQRLDDGAVVFNWDRGPDVPAAGGLARDIVDFLAAGLADHVFGR